MDVVFSICIDCEASRVKGVGRQQQEKMDEAMGWTGLEGKNNGCNKMICGERDNDISRRSMDGKTME